MKNSKTPQDQQRVSWVDEKGKNKKGVFIKSENMFFPFDEKGDLPETSSEFDFTPFVKNWKPL